jgi:RNA 3'-terminal phosphate cyclase (ATP)
LRKQHLVAVQAAQQICGAEVSGAVLGSMELAFAPGAVRPGKYRFDITSAGSTTLVAQTLLPALFLAAEPSQFVITGGTHNPLAPPFDFVAEVFLPAIGLMGYRAEAQLQRHGFYPAGGGQISLAIEPRQLQERGHTGAPAATPLDLTAPPGDIEWTGRIYDSMLPPQVVEAERSLLRQAIPQVGRIEHVRVTDSPGPGNCIMVIGEWEQHACASTSMAPRMGKTILTAFGEKGKPARAVVEELRDQLAQFVAARATVDEHLADQLLVYLALCAASAESALRPALGGGTPTPAAAPCRFWTGRLSLHATTNVAVIEKFLPVRFSSEALPAGHGVSCTPA